MMPSDALLTLRQVNQKVRSVLARLRPEQKLCSAVTAGDFSALLGELLRAGECLRNLAANAAPASPVNPSGGSDEAAALEQEAREYRSHLEQLKRFLPVVHRRLLAEKTRLQNAQTHAAAVAAWALASKKTL
jgi:hypothetical protein